MTIFENDVVVPEQLPEVDSASFQPHPERFKTKQLLVRSIFFLFLLAGPITLFIVDQLYFALAALGVWTILLMILFLSVFKSFPRRGYALRQKDIIYRKGWIFYSITSIPFNRIQHSEITQGPLDRYFKLAALNIYTAGGSGSDLTIPGLNWEEAQRLREYVANKTAEND